MTFLEACITTGHCMTLLVDDFPGAPSNEADDGSEYIFDNNNNHSSSSGSGTSEVDGIAIYLSGIKEWMIEFGSSMVFISMCTDMAWYMLGKPSKQIFPREVIGILFIY